MGAKVVVKCPVCGSKQALEAILQVVPRLARPWDERDRLEEAFRHGSIPWACEDCLRAGRAIMANPAVQVFCLHAPYLAYYDVQGVCEDCKQGFTFSASEQRFWYEELRFLLHSRPKQCAPCRRKRRAQKQAEAELGPVLAALQLTPKDPELLIKIADLYLQAGRPRKGAEYLRRAKNQVTEPGRLENLMTRIESVERQDL